MQLDLAGVAALITAVGILWNIYETKQARRETIATKDSLTKTNENIQKIETATNSLMSKAQTAEFARGKEEQRLSDSPKLHTSNSEVPVKDKRAADAAEKAATALEKIANSAKIKI